MKKSNLGLSMLQFYKTILHEMRISLIRLSSANLNHQEKMVEAIGLVMLGIVGLMPPLLFVITLVVIF